MNLLRLHQVPAFPRRRPSRDAQARHPITRSSRALERFRAPHKVGEFGSKACVARLDMSGQPCCDLLEHPAVTVWIAERRVRGVAFSLRTFAGDHIFRVCMVEYAAGVVEWPADFDAPANQFIASRPNVGDDKMQPLC
jgi:hypothetical protein